MIRKIVVFIFIALTMICHSSEIPEKINHIYCSSIEDLISDTTNTNDNKNVHLHISDLNSIESLKRTHLDGLNYFNKIVALSLSNLTHNSNYLDSLLMSFDTGQLLYLEFTNIKFKLKKIPTLLSFSENIESLIINTCDIVDSQSNIFKVISWPQLDFLSIYNTKLPLDSFKSNNIKALILTGLDYNDLRHINWAGDEYNALTRLEINCSTSNIDDIINLYKIEKLNMMEIFCAPRLFEKKIQKSDQLKIIKEAINYNVLSRRNNYLFYEPQWFDEFSKSKLADNCENLNLVGDKWYSIAIVKFLNEIRLKNLSIINLEYTNLSQYEVYNLIKEFPQYQFNARILYKANPEELSTPEMLYWPIMETIRIKSERYQGILKF